MWSLIRRGGFFTSWKIISLYNRYNTRCTKAVEHYGKSFFIFGGQTLSSKYFLFSYIQCVLQRTLMIFKVSSFVCARNFFFQWPMKLRVMQRKFIRIYFFAFFTSLKAIFFLIGTVCYYGGTNPRTLGLYSRWKVVSVIPLFFFLCKITSCCDGTFYCAIKRNRIWRKYYMAQELLSPWWI